MLVVSGAGPGWYCPGGKGLGWGREGQPAVGISLSRPRPRVPQPTAPWAWGRWSRRWPLLPLLCLVHRAARCKSSLKRPWTLGPPCRPPQVQPCPGPRAGPRVACSVVAARAVHLSESLARCRPRNLAQMSSSVVHLQCPLPPLPPLPPLQLWVRHQSHAPGSRGLERQSRPWKHPHLIAHQRALHPRARILGPMTRQLSSEAHRSWEQVQGQWPCRHQPAVRPRWAQGVPQGGVERLAGVAPPHRMAPHFPATTRRPVPSPAPQPRARSQLRVQQGWMMQRWWWGK